MTGNIYDQHKAAFANVSAYVVIDAKGERVASVAFKFPKDGAGRLYCYFHVFGVPMVRAFASGGGYDKSSAAAHSAVSRISIEAHKDTLPTIYAIKGAIKDGGASWDRDLETAGFKVVQAV